jgi:Short C-terminal domain
MFGYHPLLRHELKKNGKRAFATVVECNRTHLLETAGDPSVVSSTERLWKLTLRVEPEGEQPFEAKVDEYLPQLSSTSVGDRFPVLYDPNDHGKVVVDHSEQADEAMTDETIKEQTGDVISRMRERGQGEMADRLKAVYDAGLLQYAPTDDPQKLKGLIRERQDKIKEIMGGSNVLAGGQPLPAGGGAAGAEMTADALTKLADLRDRGVLTDAEFEAQKKKLLGG